MNEEILTREEFRNTCLERDGYKCVFCKATNGIHVHHILERRLWNDGSQGYYRSNGASVCEACHIKCGMTHISVEEVRAACGIVKYKTPEHLYESENYDSWGNIILSNGLRCKGELFYDDGCQKILAQGKVLNLFTDYVKHPRTHHLSWSENVTDDDRVIKDMNSFIGKHVIVTEKLDGENTNLYNNYYHARSIDSINHPSRNYAKALHARFAHDIPQGWRLCCENMYAEHSISYENLESYLYGLFIWNDKNECLPYNESIEWFQLFNIPVPKVLYDGIYDEAKIRAIKVTDNMEGYVIRNAGKFSYGGFKTNVAKFVKKNFCLAVKHWMAGQLIIPNKLK